MRLSIEEQAWEDCDLDDLWIFNKLIVAKMAGHTCGPRGICVPKAGEYFVKPLMNLEGMGLFAKKIHISGSTDDLHPGEFWCELFEGSHISIDYKNNEPVLAVLGTPHPKYPYSRFSRWEKTDITYPMPPFISHLCKKYETINCEFIGGKLIEVHLRKNPDFAYKNTVAIPQWKDEENKLLSDHQFVQDDNELHRAGIWVR